MALFLQFETDQSKTYPVDQNRINIGRDASNDIVLESDRVSGFHCSLFMEADGVYLADLGSSNGTFINGAPLLGKVKLQAWDTLSLADVKLIVADTESRSPTHKQPAIDEAAINRPQQAITNASEIALIQQSLNQAPVGRLALLSGDGPAVLELFEQNSIGRAPENTAVIPFSMVSGRHATIAISNDKVLLKDCQSTNGTFVNGKKVDEQQLYDGDEVAFDIVTYKVSLPGFSKPQPQLAKTGVRPIVEVSTPTKTENRPVVPPQAPKQPQDVNEADPVGSSADITRINNNDDIKPDNVPVAKKVSEAAEARQQHDRTTNLQGSTTDKQPAIHVRPEQEIRAQVNGRNENNIRRPANHSGWKWLAFSFKGRTTRKQCIFTALGFFGVSILFAAIMALLAAMRVPGIVLGVCSIAFYLAALYATLAIYCKRFHDRGKSGWWGAVLPLAIAMAIGGQALLMHNAGSLLGLGLLLINLVVQIWLFIELFCLKGELNENKYGPSPY